MSSESHNSPTGHPISERTDGRRTGAPGEALRAGEAITERRKQEEQLRRFNRILKAYNENYRALTTAEDETGYLNHVCHTLVEVCGLAMTWIGFAEQDEAKTVRPIASAGFEEGYLETLRVTWADTERGRGPTGTAIRTGRPCGCSNMHTDPQFAPWRAEALQRGYAASLVLPLLDRGRAFGAVSIYAREPEAFTAEETALLNQLADDVAQGVLTIRLRRAHRAAEAAVREREEQLRLFAEHAPAAIAMLDAQLRYVAVSRRWLEDFGLVGREVLGRSHYDLFPEIPERWKDIHRRCLAGAVERADEDPFFRADGTTQWLRWEERPWHTAAGAVGGVVIFSEDITARKRSEETLRTRMAAIDAAADAVVITDPEGVIQYVNPAFRAITGYSAAEALGGNPRVLKSGRHEQAFYAHMWRTILSGKVWHGELTNRRKDGSTYSEEMTITPVFNPQGRIQNFIALKRDITERKGTEERLQELSQRLSYHVEHSPLAVIEWGSDMRLTRWSGAAERLFGWKADEVLGKRMEDIRWVYKEDENQVAEVSGELQSGANPRRFSANRNYRKDGTVIHCEWYNSSLLDASGRLVSILSLVLDVTQRDRAEEALRRLNAELEARVAERTGQLAAANTELRAQMEAYRRLETEVAGLVEDERVRLGMELHDNLCQQLAAAALHAATLTKRLRDQGLPQAEMACRIAETLNRAGEDAHVLARGLLPVQVEAEGLMVALGGLAQHTRDMQGIARAFACAAPVLVKDNAVATHLFRIAQEAIHNAVKHGRAKRIVVELANTSGVCLTVRDDGVGIPSECQRGAGSGLRIMAYRARVIEGRLAVERGEQGGTVVRCTLSQEADARPQTEA